jgi:energy-coupling factor transporter ATP-binding protein EcfA2
VRLYTKEPKNASKNRDSESLELCLDFQVFNTQDLMTRGRAFYSIYDEKKHRWIKDEMAVVKLVDQKILEKVNELEKEGVTAYYNLMQNYESGIWQKFTSYIKNMPDNWQPLDDRLHWKNDKLGREDYATRVLPYALGPGSIENYDILMDTLYDPLERDKLEWAVGAILTGDSRYIQKFITLYGSAGSGKSTFLNIVQKIVKGYYISFNAKDLVGRDAFGLEIFKNNPLVAIQHDGDLSKIEDNSTLNSIISHEEIVMNEKHKSKYSITINCFLFLGTNKPVSIADSKSGLLRRLIDVHPSGRLVSMTDYVKLTQNINFELGAIADFCIEKYKKMGADYYQKYQPQEMMFETNTLYNFVFDNSLVFENEEYFQLKNLYEMYKVYCEESGEQYPLKKRVFRADIKTYFEEYHDVTRVAEGKQLRSVYSGFKAAMFGSSEIKPVKESTGWINFANNESIFDTQYPDILAQYASEAGTPKNTWAKCKTKLQDIDTSKLHYTMGFEDNHIVIDFDIKNEDGSKSLEKNLEAANKWPKTYAEVSKSGQGIHLHYIWGDGKADELKRIYAPDIEVKVFTGNSSLRRQVSLCNTEHITTITSGLEINEKKGGDKLLNKKNVEDEKHLRVMLKKCMKKEFHGSTKPEIDFIHLLLEEAYANGFVYDVADMKSAILAFAATSTHQAPYCIDLISKMKWSSEKIEKIVVDKNTDDHDIVFYDVEVFKNFFLVVYKMRGKGKKKVELINPTQQEIGELFEFKLAGFNNKRYDDQMLYARYLGYTNLELWELSKKIITKQGSVQHGFREAYSIAYTDVFDFCSKKQSLKKWEIELDITHEELEFDWNEPLPEKDWPKAIYYCGIDVDATEAVFEARQADWMARKILADLGDGNFNMTTNQLTTRIVFGSERHPRLEYTELEKTFPGYKFTQGEDNKWRNMYRDTDVGMGGYVYAEPGMYFNVPVMDIQSMHPTSIIVMNYFGKYTKNYADLKDARVAIKTGDLETARHMLNGKLAIYLNDESLIEDLAYALKIALNSAYGLTSASFENAMKDKRNVNNIVALRGALFMRTLQDEVQARGFTVAHIKTDSIKIPDGNEEIINFCKDFAEQYGYIFEHEATYEKMCLVNNAVFIAKYEWAEKKRLIGTWSAVGAQFAEPYVFKKLFTQEPVKFEDYKQTKTVTNPATIYLDFNEALLEGDHNYAHVGKVGSFVPVMPNTGGGVLLRQKEDKYTSVVGSKGYRWKESNIVKDLEQEDQIDLLYFNTLMNNSIKTIEKFGPIEDFIDHNINRDVEQEDLIGFDDTPHNSPIANAIFMKGE